MFIFSPTVTTLDSISRWLSRSRLSGMALFLAATLAPAVGAGRQYDFQQKTLGNGLRVITLEDASCPIEIGRASCRERVCQYV